MARVIFSMLAIVAAVSFAGQAGAQFADSTAWLFRLLALVLLGAVLALGLFLYHRRKSRELIVARYHLRGDALGWRQVEIGHGRHGRQCAECGALVLDFHAQEEHAEWHEQLAELIATGGQLKDKLREVPWTAVTELREDDSPELEDSRPAAPPDPPEAAGRVGQWAAMRDLIKNTTRETG